MGNAISLLKEPLLNRLFLFVSDGFGMGNAISLLKEPLLNRLFLFKD